ncbi:MAG: sigma-70 family RNA polymerase sigma factor, partial [Alphaproteobacteria bacterium]
MDEQQAVERLRNGDMRAIGVLMAQYKGPLYSFILRMIGNYDTAEDVFQETWIRVARAVHRFRGDSKFSTWLFQIAGNLCRDELRRVKGKTQVPVEDFTEELSCDPSVNPFKLMEAKRVREIVDELPDKMPEVVILKYFHDLGDDEIAEIAGCPEGTV